MLLVGELFVYFSLLVWSCCPLLWLRVLMFVFWLMWSSLIVCCWLSMLFVVSVVEDRCC